MKVEINFGKLKQRLSVSKWVWIFIAGLFIGAIIGIDIQNAYIQSQKIEPSCLTTTDLNRSDMSAVIVLSRFCEGMGLASSVYWQYDNNGNRFGLPICLEK